MKGPVVILGPIGWNVQGPFPVGRTAALLALIALRDGRPIGRDELAGLLWSGRPAERARQSLRQALVELRRGAAAAGRSDDLVVHPDHVRLAGSPASDWAIVRSIRAETIDDLRAALAYFRGDPLPGIPDEWATSPRTAARATERRLLAEIGEQELSADPASALARCDRGLALDDSDERLIELRWAALSALGDSRSAERERADHSARLRERTGIGPVPRLLPHPLLRPSSLGPSPFDAILAAIPRRADRVRILLASVPYFRESGRAEEGLARLRALGSGGLRAGERAIAEAELELARGDGRAAERILRDLADREPRGQLGIRARLALSRALATRWELGESRLAALRALRIAVTPEDRLECHRALAVVHERRRDPRRARRSAERMRRLAEHLSDGPALALATEIFAYAAYYSGEVAAARSAAGEAIRQADAGGAGPRGPYIRVRMARLAEEWGDDAFTSAQYRQGLDALRAGEERAWLGAALAMAGDYAVARNRAEEGHDLLEESLEIRESLGDRVGIATAHRGLGLARAAMGEEDAARDHLRRSASLLRRSYPGGFATAVLPLAKLELGRRPDRAARLAALALEILQSLPPSEVAALVVRGDRLIPTAQSLLQPDKFIIDNVDTRY